MGCFFFFFIGSPHHIGNRETSFCSLAAKCKILSFANLPNVVAERQNACTHPNARQTLGGLLSARRLSSAQAKKRQYDQEVENMEKKQKQTIERLEQDHTSRLRDEAKRIKADQDKELSKFQNMMKNRKKEVGSDRTRFALGCEWFAGVHAC